MSISNAEPIVIHEEGAQASTATPASLQVSEWSDAASWDAFVASADGGSICHLFRWKQIIGEAYNQQTFYFAAHEETRLRGILPLVLTRSPVFGTHATSMPYLDFGGILADGEAARRVLFERARSVCTANRAALNLRYKQEHHLPASTSTHRFTLILELGDNADQLWSRLPSERRNRVRKGRKNGLSTSWHTEDGLADFFDVFSRNMRDLGSPVHGLHFFRCILKHFGDRAAILLIRDGATTIGAAFCLFHEDTMFIPWISSLRPYFRKCPNPLLYWEAMRYGIERGHRFLDFGRSAEGDGTFEAKRQWGATPVQLHWVYEPEDRGQPGTPSEKRQKMEDVWRRLPLAVTNRLGPWIRKGHPG